MAAEFSLETLQYRPLSEVCLRGVFACGENAIDGWFRKKAQDHHDKLWSRVTTVHIGDDPVPIAFYALSLILEEERLLDKQSRIRRWGNSKVYPALHLEYLAVGKVFQARKIGTAMMGRVLDQFCSVAEAAGVPVLTLVPLNADVVRFYEGIGFEAYGPKSSCPRMMLDALTALQLRDEHERAGFDEEPDDLAGLNEEQVSLL